MTKNEFLLCLIFTFLLAFMSWIHHQEVKMLVMIAGSGDMAVARALDLVMGGYTLERGKK